VPWLGSLNMAAIRFTHAIFALLLLGTDYLKLAVWDIPRPVTDSCSRIRSSSAATSWA